MMSAGQSWNASMYDDKFQYVSNYGMGNVELLQPARGERILDLGCGTGDLSYEIAKTGAIVIGMDYSVDMIRKAREKYPDIAFIVDDGESFRTKEQVDAVFSNAALHWMKNAEQVVQSVGLALRPGGRFVAEFGGKGNIQTVIRGIVEVLQEECGIDTSERNPWYFPSIGEYSSLLEKNGFSVSYAQYFHRPTALPDGDVGLFHFLDSFAKSFFPAFTAEDKQNVYERIREKVRSDLYKDGVWYADYKRIRIAATKTG